MIKLALILLRFAWAASPEVDSYRLYYLTDDSPVLIAETTATTIDVMFPQFAVSAIRGGAESELSESAIVIESSCAAKISELRKVCGKKCSKVK